MIVREIEHHPELLENFDWFNDYNDTRAWALRCCPRLLAQLDSGYAAYLKRTRGAMYKHKKQVEVKLLVQSHSPITDEQVATAVLLAETTLNGSDIMTLADLRRDIRALRFHAELIVPEVHYFDCPVHGQAWASRPCCGRAVDHNEQPRLDPLYLAAVNVLVEWDTQNLQQTREILEKAVQQYRKRHGL